jgi:hypothetical protein
MAPTVAIGDETFTPASLLLEAAYAETGAIDSVIPAGAHAGRP